MFHDSHAPEAAPIDWEYSAALPNWLSGTAAHVNCPGVFVVDVLSIRDGRPIRAMAFVGTVTRGEYAGYVVVAMPRENGYAGHFHVLAPNRIGRHGTHDRRQTNHKSRRTGRRALEAVGQQ